MPPRGILGCAHDVSVKSCDVKTIVLQRAKANGLVVPLNDHKIYIYWASTSGLTPRRGVQSKSIGSSTFLQPEPSLSRIQQTVMCGVDLRSGPKTPLGKENT